MEYVLERVPAGTRDRGLVGVRRPLRVGERIEAGIVAGTDEKRAAAILAARHQHLATARAAHENQQGGRVGATGGREGAGC